MHTHAEKSNQSKTQSDNTSSVKGPSQANSTLQFTDKRQQTKRTAQLQAIADEYSGKQQNPIQKMTSVSHSPKCGCANCNNHTAASISSKTNEQRAISAPVKTDSSSVIQRAYCSHCKRDIVDSDRHNRDCSKFSVRTFQTNADKNAPVLTRSHSFDRLRGRSGSFDRVHEHENKHTDRRFEHVIGHTDRDGNYTGRPY